MISSSLQYRLHQLFAEKLNSSISSLEFESISGGSINKACRVTVNDRLYFFIKVNSSSKFSLLFHKEKNGLEWIERQQIIKTPQVIDCIEHDAQQLLILEWINSGERTDNFWIKFGEQLAALHRVSNKNFGFMEDNYMGSVVQMNTWSTDWNAFFIEQRLQPLIMQGYNKRLLSKKHIAAFEKLSLHIPGIFNNEPPALLHGDLWSGNVMCNELSQPVLIDPAVYFGHRSVDLGMTTLFGGFDASFYEASHYHYPFPANYREQWKLCNLYPLLIHLLLFGKSYLSQIEETLYTFE